MRRVAETWAAALRALRRPARAAGRLWPLLGAARPDVRLEVEQLSAELLEALERLAERNEALRKSLPAQVGHGSLYDLCQTEIAALRHRVTEASKDLPHLRGRWLDERRFALDLLKVEVSGLASEMDGREAGWRRWPWRAPQ